MSNGKSAVLEEAFLEQASRTTEPFRSEYDFEPHGFHAAKGWMHYVDEGDAAAETMLCVHGNPSWSFYYRPVIKAFRDKYRVVAVDNLGCGLSEKPQDFGYTLKDHIDNLEALVLALDLTEITLVLHDWGGAIGMGFAVRHPDRIAKVMLGNTSAFHVKRLPLRIAICRWPFFGALALRGFNGFAKAATTMAVEKPMTDLAKRGYLAPYNSWHNRIAQHRFVLDIPMKPSHPTWDVLDQIDKGLPLLKKKPMAIAWGMKDWCFTLIFLGGWRQRFPRAEVLEIPDAGHYMWEDASDVALPFLAKFMEAGNAAPKKKKR
ncbi:MAG: haloalkane dehalogenase [Planctomycetota bacterium]|jgi:haloalkane dehalogenase